MITVTQSPEEPDPDKGLPRKVDNCCEQYNTGGQICVLVVATVGLLVCGVMHQCNNILMGDFNVCLY